MWLGTSTLYQQIIWGKQSLQSFNFLPSFLLEFICVIHFTQPYSLTDWGSTPADFPHICHTTWFLLKCDFPARFLFLFPVPGVVGHAHPISFSSTFVYSQPAKLQPSHSSHFLGYVSWECLNSSILQNCPTVLSSPGLSCPSELANQKLDTLNFKFQKAYELCIPCSCQLWMYLEIKESYLEIWQVRKWIYWYSPEDSLSLASEGFHVLTTGDPNFK